MKFCNPIFSIFALCVLGSCQFRKSTDSQVETKEVLKNLEIYIPEKNVGLNDFAVLMPLPTSGSTAGLVSLTIGDTPASMIGKEIVKKIPKLIETVTPSISSSVFELLPNLKVLAIRFDPCFVILPADTNCIPQMRLVVQPVEVTSSQANVNDAAIHLAYGLKMDEFKTLIRDLTLARGKIPDNVLAVEPLGVNPTLINQGLDGDYGKALQAAIAKYAVEPRLMAVAFMVLRDRGNQWVFGGFAGTPGKLQPTDVAGTSPKSNTIRFSMGVRRELGLLVPCCGSIDPKTSITDSTADLVRAFGSSQKTTIDLTIANQSLDRIENPTVHTPSTVDCVSCHTAAASRDIANQLDPGFQYTPNDRYKSSWPLKNESSSQGDLTNLRAFGYKASTPSFNYRTINETAESLRYFGSL